MSDDPQDALQKAIAAVQAKRNQKQQPDGEAKPDEPSKPSVTAMASAIAGRIQIQVNPALLNKMSAHMAEINQQITAISEVFLVSDFFPLMAAVAEESARLERERQINQLLYRTGSIDEFGVPIGATPNWLEIIDDLDDTPPQPTADQLARQIARERSRADLDQKRRELRKRKGKR